MYMYIYIYFKCESTSKAFQLNGEEKFELHFISKDAKPNEGCTHRQNLQSNLFNQLTLLREINSIILLPGTPKIINIMLFYKENQNLNFSRKIITIKIINVMRFY